MKGAIETFDTYWIRCKRCGEIKPKEEFSRFGVSHRICRSCLEHKNY